MSYSIPLRSTVDALIAAAVSTQHTADNASYVHAVVDADGGVTLFQNGVEL